MLWRLIIFEGACFFTARIFLRIFADNHNNNDYTWPTSRHGRVCNISQIFLCGLKIFFCGLKLISNCMYNTKNLNLSSACNVFCIRDLKKIKALTCFKVYVRYKGNRFFLHSRTIFKYQVKTYGVKCINYTCLSRLL